MDPIEGFPEINEDNEKKWVPLYSLINNDSQSKNLIWATSSFSELHVPLGFSGPDPTTLIRFRITWLNTLLGIDRYYFARIITNKNIPFLWYFHYQTLSPIFWYIFLLPHFIEKGAKDSDRCWQVNPGMLSWFYLYCLVIVITQNLIVRYFEKNVFIGVKMIEFSYNVSLFSILWSLLLNNEKFPLFAVVFVYFLLF